MQYIHSLCRFLSLILLLLSPIWSIAQTFQGNSPYSRSGFGNQYPREFAYGRSMGYATTALQLPSSINYANPASYSSLRLTTFETAVAAQSFWLANANERQQFNTGSLGYLSLGFPVTKFWGAAIGLQPYSYLSYDLTDIRVSTPVDAVSDTTRYRFRGSGSTYQFYIGNGFKWKGLSVGANIGYVFGTTSRQVRSSIISLPDYSNSNSSQKTESLLIGDFIWDAGIQYRQKLGGDYTLTLGFAGNAAMNINAKRDVDWVRLFLPLNNGSSSDIYSGVDTVTQSVGEKGKIVLPARYSGGIAIQRGEFWTISTDVAYEKGKDYRSFGNSDSTLNNSLRVAAGVAFSPDPRAFNSFWEKTIYRMGAYYNTGRLTINGTRLPEFAFTLGIGMPLRKTSSRINLGIEVGQRGTVENSLIRENFVNFLLGITLNDQWFLRRKYE